jgi:hypothetical protein
MNATERMLAYLKQQIESAAGEIEAARAKYDFAVSLKSAFETIITDQEKFDKKKNEN